MGMENIMNRYIRRALSAYLASAALAMSPGLSATMLPAMEDFPMTLVDGIIDEMLDAEMSVDEKLKVLATIATDRRADVRIRVGELLCVYLEELDSALAMPLLAQLAGDRDPSVRNELRRALAEALTHMNTLTRTAVVADLAFSSSKSLRHILVTTLNKEIYCLGVPSLLAHLSQDPGVLVRRAVVDVAVARMNENPRAYQRILKSLCNDCHVPVRRAARNAVQRLKRRNYNWHERPISGVDC